MFWAIYGTAGVNAGGLIDGTKSALLLVCENVEVVDMSVDNEPDIAFLSFTEFVAVDESLEWPFLLWQKHLRRFDEFVFSGLVFECDPRRPRNIEADPFIVKIATCVGCRCLAAVFDHYGNKVATFMRAELWGALPSVFGASHALENNVSNVEVGSKLASFLVVDYQELGSLNDGVGGNKYGADPFDSAPSIFGILMSSALYIFMNHLGLYRFRGTCIGGAMLLLAFVPFVFVLYFISMAI